MAHHFRRPELFLLLVQLLFRWNREVEWDKATDLAKIIQRSRTHFEADIMFLLARLSDVDPDTDLDLFAGVDATDHDLRHNINICVALVHQ